MRVGLREADEVELRVTDGLVAALASHGDGRLSDMSSNEHNRTMRRISPRASTCTLALLTLLLLSACAHIPGLVSDVDVGMDRQSAIDSVLKLSTPTFYYLEERSIEYVLFRNVYSFGAMYSEYPHAVEFIRLEDGRVVDKGIVGKKEEKRIQEIRPNFVLRDWQGKGEVPADHHDDGKHQAPR